MESYASRNRAVRYRQPLTDTTNWVNNLSSTPPRPSPMPQTPSSPPTCLPHHDSLEPGGNLQIRNNPNPPPVAIVDKRISAISAEEKRNTNRDSQISTSTNNSTQSRRRKTHVGPWQLGKSLGKGASGRVRAARHVFTRQEAAIKIVSKVLAKKLRTTSLAHMEKLLPKEGRDKRAMPFGIGREVIILKLIQHPNVTGLYDVWENRGELYLVLEYVEGGELFKHISEHGQLPESEAVRLFRQLISGLSYLHRFNICHRDLKPENLLLDKNRNIKIADFGMAVLQPANTSLRTSCGSPHYAAPEVIRGAEYRGDRADIWSSGVILYAMLAGCLPFDSQGAWEDVIATVIEGQYTFPDHMTRYAQDLIDRMLQKEPSRRIPIKNMWHHPLLQRWEHLDAGDANGQPYIGPLPPLTVADCGERLYRVEDIDEELLGNLQMLFHGTEVEELAARLIGDEPNFEKILYTKLLHYRDEQLEDYQGVMEYSASDYHHRPQYRKPPPMPTRSSTRASLRRTQLGQAQSQYSILVDETPRRSVSVQRRPSSNQGRPSSSAGTNPKRYPSVAETQSSYDPYRSSRARFHKPQADHTRVTVLRNLSNHNDSAQPSLGATSRRNPSKASSNQHPSPLPSPENDVFSIFSSPPGQFSSQLARMRQERRVSRGSSRHTFASATGTRVVRKSASYRRGVSFSHIRKRSASAGIQNSSSLAPPTSNVHRASSNPLPSVPASPEHASSPRLPAPTVRSRKQVPTFDEQAIIKPRITSQIWKEDTRKVSKELENFCDEAFNRASVASSVPTTNTAATEGRSVGTPVTSYSAHDTMPYLPAGAGRRVGKSSQLKEYQNRPLPAPPVEDLGSYDRQELAQLKDSLLKHEYDLPSGLFDEVIVHLDRLMQPSAIRLQEEERRAFSAPDPKLAPNKDTFERFLEGRDVALRSASEPIPESPRKRKRFGDTIRVVDDRNELKISPTKPLTIRKKSSSPNPLNETFPQQASREKLLRMPPLPDTRTYYDRYQPSERRSAGLNMLDNSLEPIEEHADDKEYEPKEHTVKKKKSWFFRGGHEKNKSQENASRLPPLPPKEQGFQNFGGKKETSAWKRTSDPRSEASQKSEEKKEGTSGKAKFLRLFGKGVGLKSKRSSQELKGDYDLEDEASICSTSTNSPHAPYLMSGALPNKSTASVSRSRDRPPYPEYRHPTHNKSSLSVESQPMPLARQIQPQHQNWLMKFLRIKPAVMVLPFQVSRVRARKEMVALLKEWRRYGMRDIVVDNRAGRVSCRVGVNNSLNIRPVSLAIETFTVLERGRKANLSLARFTQEKGAKSSFERVVKTMEKVLGNKGLLVEDEVRARQMKGILVG